MMQDPQYHQSGVAGLSHKISQLLAVRTLLERVKAAEKELKDEIDAELPAGSKIAGKIAGHKLGSVWKTDPSPVAHVVSEDQFLGHLEYRFEDQLVTRIVIRDEDLPEVAAVLQDHGADDLMEVVTEPPQWLVQQELRKAEAGEDIPGVELREKPPVVSARAAKDAAAAVEQLVRDGHLDITTLALESGQ